MRTKKITRGILLTCLAVGGVAVALWRFRFSGMPEQQAIVEANPHLRATSTTNVSAVTRSSPDISTAAKSLKQGGSSEISRQSLGKLRSHLDGLGNAAASRTVREWLDSGADAPTHLDFKLAVDGSLKEAPTLRTFLLDYLIQIDPQAAAACAEKILQTATSPDEWAVSLRAYALANPTPEARAFLRQKVGEMIRLEPWQKNPSVGFLEAFDVAVYAGGTELLPPLTDLLRQKDNKAVAHAAYLALDRLTLQDAVAVLGELQDRPDLMAGREATRANYFARANVEDAQQKAILENYLLDPRITTAELEVFAGIYPNGNFMISHNLLTQNPTPDRPSQARQDREAMRVVESWLADPRFEKIKPHLETIKSRIGQFVPPAATAR